MGNGGRRAHQHFRLDVSKIRRAQKVLKVGTETETIERALDLVISEHRQNRLAAKAIERFAASGVSRVLLPNLSDWTQTGRTLAILAGKYDQEQIGRGRLTNGSLIAASAGRVGVTVITANGRDFGRLAEFPHFGRRVESLPH